MKFNGSCYHSRSDTSSRSAQVQSPWQSESSYTSGTSSRSRTSDTARMRFLRRTRQRQPKSVITTCQWPASDQACRVCCSCTGILSACAFHSWIRLVRVWAVSGFPEPYKEPKCLVEFLWDQQHSRNQSLRAASQQTCQATVAEARGICSVFASCKHLVPKPHRFGDVA